MRFLSLHPGGENSITVRSILAIVRKDTIAIEHAARELGRRPTQAALRVASLAVGVPGEITTGVRLLTPLDDPSRPPAERGPSSHSAWAT